MKSKKWRQSAHNKATGKYVRQKVRTSRNKMKRIARNNMIRENKGKVIKKNKTYKQVA